MPNQTDDPAAPVLARTLRAVLACVTTIGLLTAIAAGFTTPLPDPLAAIASPRAACQRDTAPSTACGTVGVTARRPS